MISENSKHGSLFSPTNGRLHEKTGICKSINEAKVQTIHEVRKPVGVRRAVKLSDIHDIVLIFQNGCFVVVHVQIVWRRENCHDCRELGSSSLTVHAISGCKSQ